MTIKLSDKFADKHLDDFISSVYSNFEKDRKDKYTFDLTDVEYIANQELLVLSSIFSLFIKNNIDFEVLLFKKGISTNEIPKRVRKQIIELWTVWEIWRIIPNKEYYKYFNLDGSSIELIQKEDNYYPSKAELYGRYGVTPFIQLDFINNYNANEIQNRISTVFKLSDAIEEILEKNKCHHPFTSKSLSAIISEELYLNFLDHSSVSSFSGFNPYASLSISFKNKLRDEIVYLNKKNFETEQIPETKSFFFNSFKKEYHNRGYLEFSFLDFGSGIPKTLNSELPNTTEDEILKFAFQHNSSRHPISIIDNKPENYITRGLFDVLTIVRRYSGLLIVRSNYGKILYDFSSTDNVNEAYKTFGNNKSFFPGTLISLYIPAIENEDILDETSIKPEIVFDYIKPTNKLYLNLNQILKNVPEQKEKLYSQSLKQVRKHILFNQDEPTIVYLSFLGCNIEDRLARKILIYLLTDYDINIKTNVVLIHSPKDEVIEGISKIINSLSPVYKKYKIHPIPLINYDISLDEFNIKWLGIYDDYDIKKLDNLLFTEYSLAKSDFNEPSYIEGHLTSFDNYGNLTSHFPDRETLVKLFNNEGNILSANNLKTLLEESNGIVKDNGNDLYLCNGNYYQREYIEINNIINSKKELETITNLFYEWLKKEINIINEAYFISITSTSNKISQSFLDLGFISEKQQLSFEDFHSFEVEFNKNTVNPKNKYILICDVISTGFLTEKIANKLTEKGVKLDYVGVLVSVVDDNFRTEQNYLKTISGRIISILDYKIQKFETNEIKEEIIKKNIIRINPYTNIPIRLSFEETNYNDSIIFHSTVEYDENSNLIVFKNEFLDSVNDENLKVGYYKFNNVIHPYFFDTKPILDNLAIKLLKKIFSKVNKPKLNSEKVLLFYPRDSGIKSDVFFRNLKSGIGNDKIEEIEIDRINTKEGWRFPHNSNHLSSKVDGNLCLIIDDGSSSGDSLIQMIDEISFYNAKEIVLLCFIGRINDHKREFFSRLSSIRVKNGNPINLSVYFATHWHIPTYYLDSNPIIKETNWLNELINIANTPNSIKKIAKRILEEIEPKNKTFKDYKYLPKVIGTKTVPKKELIKRREEIGKVIGYRLYKESFKYFDAFIRKYSQNKKEENRYEEIELVCACFVYEPYLYEKISKILPDVVSLIEDFVKYLIYSYDKYEKHKSYDWDKKDVIHLFFIVFKDEKLIEELNEENFLKLIEFTSPKESSLDYILYKLTRYIPINKKQLNTSKYDIEIKQLIQSLIESRCKNYNILKQYLNFTSTLPSRGDFKSQLFNLQLHYKKQREEDLHLNKKQFGHYVSAFSAIIGKLIANIESGIEFETEDIKKIKNLWVNITDFTTPILNFTSSFPEFLTPYPSLKLYKQLEQGDYSVRTKIGYNNDAIFSIDENFRDTAILRKIDKNIKEIQLEIDENSLFFKLVSSNTTDLKTLIDELLKKIIENELSIIETKEEIIAENTICEIPNIYSQQLIIKEIINNIINHSILEKGIQFILHKENDSIILILKNDIKKKDFPNSTREGLRCLTNLSESNLFGFSYEKEKSDNQFIQTLKFKINGN
ncbi:hypothetical protein [Hyunsoonleella rubra]|uniref:Phosphoribosyltransferase domain-containing protein n=1 Tax=Hyunsoonleella rubra TaxID=1737062 RepID=A0ABW5TDP5_9FLAO